MVHGLLLLPNLVNQRSRLLRIFVGTGFKKIVFTLRSQQDRSALTSFIIVDAQSVKNTDTAQNKGYDGGNKISGIKRHVAVDINGFPQVIHITRANVSDRDGSVRWLPYMPMILGMFAMF